MMSAFDAFAVVSETDGIVIRNCSFCDAHIEDLLGKRTSFVSHLPIPISKRREKAWADHLDSINRVRIEGLRWS